MILEAVMIGVFSALFGNKKKGMSALAVVGLIIALFLGVWAGSKVKPETSTEEKPKSVPPIYTNYTDDDIIPINNLTSPVLARGVIIFASGGSVIWDEKGVLSICDRYARLPECGYCNCSFYYSDYLMRGKSCFEFIFRNPVTIQPLPEDKIYVLTTREWGGRSSSSFVTAIIKE